MASSRVVVVVPRQETHLHEYLQRSLACLPDVEVVLDRRTIATTTPMDERRQSSSNTERKILLCSIVHCPAPPPALPEPPEEATSGKHHRTLLWPALRLEHL
jgi:hypothetical protein